MQALLFETFSTLETAPERTTILADTERIVLYISAASLGVAFLSFLMAGASVYWQVRSWRKQRKTWVEVGVSSFIPSAPSPRLLSAAITAINRSEHPVDILVAGFEKPDPRTVWDRLARRERPNDPPLMIQRSPPGSSVPGVVAARSRGLTWLEASNFIARRFDPYKPIVGFVIDATGATFRSKPTTLGQDYESWGALGELVFPKERRWPHLPARRQRRRP